MAIRVRRYLKQVLTYWAKKLSDRQGQNTYESPVELRCRWDDGDAQVVEPDGRTVNFDGYVMLDTDIARGGLIFLGTLDSVKAIVQFPTVPSTKQGAREIKRIRKTMSRKGILTLVEVWV